MTCDANFDQVALLILADAITGGGGVVDDSPFASVNTPLLNGPGTGAYVTTGGPFGSGSPYFDLANILGGTSPGVQFERSSIAALGPMDLSSGDFTIECWFLARATAAQFIGKDTSANLIVGLQTGTLYVSYDGAGGNLGAAVSLGSWHHFALVMHDNSWVAYLDGVAANSPNAVTRTSWVGSNFFCGGNGAGAAMPGAVTNLRITSAARYLTNFTPPTSAFPSSQCFLTCDANFNQVGLLVLAADGTPALNALDNSAFGIPLIGQGATNLFTTGGPFGSGSPYLDLANVPGGTSTGWDLQTPTIAAGGPLDLSTGDYTIEGWFYVRSTTASNMFTRDGAAFLNVACLTGVLYAQVEGTGGLTSTPFTSNAWHHVAIVMQSNSFVVYIDGVASMAPQSVSRNSWVGNIFYVGGYSGGSEWPGNISNIRVTKNFARYSGTFIPPAAPFPALQCVTADADFPDNGLLIPFDGPDGALIATDVSNASLPITWGNPTHTTISQDGTLFGSGCLLLGGHAAYSVTSAIAASGPIDLSTGDFTIEFWARMDGNIFSSNMPLLDTLGGGSTGVQIYYDQTANTFTSNIGGAFPVPNSTVAPAVGAWFHVALVKQGTNGDLFINGVSTTGGTGTVVGASPGTSATLTLGASPSSGVGWDGALDELRITKGLARYTPGTSFAPPSTQFGQDSAVSPLDVHFANVSLLIDFDGYNNQTTFTDLSSNTFPMTAVASGSVIATTTTNNPRFGTACLRSLNAASASSVQTPASGPVTAGGPLDVTSGDFTVEGWFLTTDPTLAQIAAGCRGAGGGSVGWYVGLGSSTPFFALVDPGPVTITGPSGTINAGQWYHVTLCRSGNNYGVAVDGVFGSTVVLAGAMGTPTTPMQIGGTVAGVWSGQVDEFRITKGLARYTPGTNFSPPLLPFGGPATTANVPNVVGQPLATAEANIVAALLVVGTVTPMASGSVPAGDVISTSPVAGTLVSVGSSVNILESTGIAIVPNVVGDSLSVAEAAIIAATLTVGTTTAVISLAPPMQVLTQSPVGGTPYTGAVDLTYSEGEIVPDITNTSVTVIAPGILAAVGFVLGAIGYHVSGTVIAGNIISQSPAAGTFAAAGSAVSVVVSSGLPPLTVPDIYGLSQADAELALTTLGLVVGAIGSAPSQFVPPGTVQAQNPSAGTPVAVGTIVSFVLSLGTPATSTAFDFEATVISQYANSPTILQLVNNLNSYIDQSANFANFFNFVWNVDTAVGFGLDVWGKIVGVSRLLHIPSSVDYVGFDNSATPPPDWQPMGSNQDSPPVGGAMYTGYNATQTYLLGDDAYRQLILAKAFANIASTTAPAINQILQNLYGEGTAFVLNEGPMAISYNLTFTPSAIQLAILEQSGVIPTPPGVSVTINTNV